MHIIRQTIGDKILEKHIFTHTIRQTILHIHTLTNRHTKMHTHFDKHYTHK